MEPIIFKKRPVTKTTQKYTQRFDVDVDEPKVEKQPKARFTDAFWIAWAEFVKSADSAFRETKWPAKWALWVIIKQEVENKK